MFVDGATVSRHFLAPSSIHLHRYRTETSSTGNSILDQLHILLYGLKSNVSEVRDEGHHMAANIIQKRSVSMD